ncbi:MAG: long-chain acyl-CoA synthetase [Acidobacteriaceae bacterium]|jgi:long-chain acyl-CoA synthetase|nr:long-chain acyl-CoA synthetase [Acidobacteriaceae bacterium]
MANFLESIFAQLQRADEHVVLREIHGETFTTITGRELFALVQRGRSYVRKFGLVPGDRCALLGANSIQWVAVDLALMAEGIIVVPLYSRQAAGELASMMTDCSPSLLIVGDAELGSAIEREWPERPNRVLMEEVARAAPAREPVTEAANARTDGDLVTIIYTSGTSGEPKGVCLNVGNVTHMLRCTGERLDQLMGASSESGESDKVFHYLPFNFAGSWILLLSCLLRESVLTLSTDLNRLADEIRLSAPNYFLNVPTLLERVRRGVLDSISKRAAPIRMLFTKAKAAWERERGGTELNSLDAMWLALGRRLIFAKVKERFGGNVRALICGSAPLAVETQQFFMMLGIPVLQVYGLTETTAICTMDDPRAPVEPGYVGPAISGIEMNTADNEEIIVRGPHIFPGYWNRPEETARVIKDGWLHTGDQGEKNKSGNWQIIGRIKNLIILNSGHNVPPEPIEETIAQRLAGAQQVVVVGNGRGYLCALITGQVTTADAQNVIDTVNTDLPHYRQIRNFSILPGALTAEDGLLTVNGKLRRDAIDRRFSAEIATMYSGKSA